ncbi:hypothetical protein [Levilactobacillus brevis]|nr:hypothetical protein [Levilactobacillus brevis]
MYAVIAILMIILIPNCQIKCNTFDLFLVIGLVNRSLAELPLPIDS